MVSFRYMKPDSGRKEVFRGIMQAALAGQTAAIKPADRAIAMNRRAFDPRPYDLEHNAPSKSGDHR